MNERWTLCERTVSARWELCERWTSSEQSGEHKWTHDERSVSARWVHYGCTVNAWKNGKAERFMDCSIYVFIMPYNCYLIFKSITFYEGADLAGTFCVLHNASNITVFIWQGWCWSSWCHNTLQQLRLDGEVDLLTTVRLTHTRRPEVITKMVMKGKGKYIYFTLTNKTPPSHRLEFAQTHDSLLKYNLRLDISFSF